MIHLVNMPFASLLHPSLALGQIKPQLAEAGMRSRVFNVNLDLARRIGLKEYETLATLRGVRIPIGEWTFAASAWREPFGPSVEEFLDPCDEEMAALGHLDDPRQWLIDLRNEVVPAFLEDCCERLAEAGEPRVVAFTCTFFQTVAALALARRLKERFPGVKIAFGGACFHGEMGDEYIRKIPWIDAVATGEADDVIVPLFRALAGGDEPAGLQGILYRDRSGAIASGPPHQPISAEVLNRVPDPDFDEYFEDLERAGVSLKDGSVRVRVFLPYESSRGCWWGQKQHCTFCGLNAEGMSFRVKKADRVLETLRGFARRYPVRRFHATDNILPTQYFKDFLPRLRDDPLSREVELFYEIKSNVSREWMKLLSEAGVRYLQPGIESLSTNLLRCVRKGVKAIQNVYLLKLCRVYDVYPLWNVLLRIPGERSEDYREMAELVPKIQHFVPPFGGSRHLEVHRFSPYHFEKERWVYDVRPRPGYDGLFPFDRLDPLRIAYYFDADWKDTLGGDAYDEIMDSVSRWIDAWSESSELPRLQYNPRQADGLDIMDSRRGRFGTWRLDVAEALVYHAIDDPKSAARVGDELGGRAGSVESIEARLRDFVANGLAIEEDGQYLGLALAYDVPNPSAQFRRRFIPRPGRKGRRGHALPV